jgi:predicted DNA-binding transcriptional regulator AlpA
MESDALVSKRDVLLRTLLSERTISRGEREGWFPRRRRISAGRVGWLTSEIEKYLRSLPAGPLTARTAAAAPAGRDALARKRLRRR